MSKNKKSGWQSIKGRPTYEPKKIKIVEQGSKEHFDYMRKHPTKLPISYLKVMPIKKEHSHNFKSVVPMHLLHKDKLLFYYEKTGGVPNMVATATNNKNDFIISLPDSMEFSKDLIAESLEEFFVLEKINRYTILLEAWMSDTKGKTEYSSPSQDPNAKSISLIYTEGIEGKFCMSSWVIPDNRKEKLKSYFEKMDKDIDWKEAERGRFMGLLKKRLEKDRKGCVLH
jgi:hypothetical protein